MQEGKTTEHRAWRNMLDRCYNPRCSDFRRYGARGITVCDSWNRTGPRKGCGAAYRNFLKDMGRKPTRFHVLDRINVDGPYSPQNCRWVTPDISRLNKRAGRLTPEERKTGMRHVLIPSGLHMRMKLLAAENGMFLEAIMERALKLYIESHEQKKPTN